MLRRGSCSNYESNVNIVMEYTNECLAQVIISADPSATWVYNKHCPYCGRYLYPEETVKCKKCKTSTTNALSRPIPFLSSAAAIEKLLIWLRNPKYKEILNQVEKIIISWLNSDRGPDTYRLEIVVICVNRLPNG